MSREWQQSLEFSSAELEEIGAVISQTETTGKKKKATKQGGRRKGWMSVPTDSGSRPVTDSTAPLAFETAPIEPKDRPRSEYWEMSERLDGVVERAFDGASAEKAPVLFARDATASQEVEIDEAMRSIDESIAAHDEVDIPITIDSDVMEPPPEKDPGPIELAAEDLETAEDTDTAIARDESATQTGAIHGEIGSSQKTNAAVTAKTAEEKAPSSAPATPPVERLQMDEDDRDHRAVSGSVEAVFRSFVSTDETNAEGSVDKRMADERDTIKVDPALLQGSGEHPQAAGGLSGPKEARKTQQFYGEMSGVADGQKKKVGAPPPLPDAGAATTQPPPVPAQNAGGNGPEPAATVAPPPVPDTPAPAAKDLQGSEKAQKPSKPAKKSAPKKGRKRRKKPWFEDFFDDDYLLTLPHETPEGTLREAEFIARMLDVQPGGRLLDLGCGYGRHAVELAQKGYDLVGLDNSLPMLIRGGQLCEQRGVEINFMHADMKELTFEEEFDGVYCVTTSFGYFDDETNKQVVRQVYNALKPGGRFLLEVVNRDYLLGDLPLRVWWEGEECLVMEEVEFNYFTSCVESQRSVVFNDGRQVDRKLSIRVYSLHELGKLLHEVGFIVREVTGNIATEGRFFGLHSPQLIIRSDRGK